MPKPKTTKPRETAAAPEAIPARVLAAVGAVVALALLGALDYYQRELGHRNTAAANQVPLIQERFSVVPSVTPEDAVLAYLSDVPFEQGGSSLHASAQYAIAPRLLDTSAAYPRDWILGNFYGTYDAADIAEKRRWRVVRDFGNGIVVFRRGSR